MTHFFFLMLFPLAFFFLLMAITPANLLPLTNKTTLKGPNCSFFLKFLFFHSSFTLFQNNLHEGKPDYLTIQTECLLCARHY